MGRWPQAWRAARLFHGQDDDEQGLVQVAVVELGRLAESLGDKLVSVVEFFQDREFIGMHIFWGLRVHAVAGGGNQAQGFLHVFGSDGLAAGLGGFQPGGPGQQV